MTTTETPLDTARRPAAVEATIAVVRELAADVRAIGPHAAAATRAAELRGARRVLARLAGARYMALDTVSGWAVADRWDRNAILRGTYAIGRRPARDLADEQNALNAAEIDAELRAELTALDPSLRWPADV